MNPNLPNLRKGDVVAGRFRVVEIIGSGGFSVVYRAHQEGMNRFVALKVLKPKASADAQIVERFRREALFASHLSHPNTITLYDYGHTEDGLCYIAMEYLVGMDLSDVVSLGQPMDLKRVWKVLTQCCRSLSEAHKLGLIHRDLKPENIFLMQRKDGEFVKVLDFGVSKAINEFGSAGPRTMAPLTQQGTVFGTPLYMAPEQAMADALTPAVDVYALGHIGYEMITGRAAYADSTNAMDVMLRQINDPPLRLAAPWNTTPFAPLIERATQKKPAERYADAAEMLTHLLDEAFLPYMDVSEQPSGVRTTPYQPAVTVPQEDKAVDTLPTDPFEALEREHGNEIATLFSALDEVLTTGQARFVVLEGDSRSARNEILNGFMVKAAERDRRVNLLTRPPRAKDGRRDIGLEGEISRLVGGELRTSGMGEIGRHLREIDGHDSGLFSAYAAGDGSSLDAMSALRDQLLLRVGRLFRNVSRNGVIVWGLENLEQADALTLAYLEWFIGDLQREDAPIMIVAAVHPETLVKRPGMLRYTRALMTTPSPRLRKLLLGGPVEKDSAGVTAWRTQSGRHAAASQVRQEASVAAEVLDGDSDYPKTERFDLFTGASDSSTRDSGEAEEAFDEVLGLLAMLGLGPVTRALWTQACQQVLEGPVALRANFIVQHASRFGLVDDGPHGLSFRQPHLVESFGAPMAQRSNAARVRGVLAELLLEHYREPSDEQVRLIVDHALAGGKHSIAARLLQEMGDAAYRRGELDAAREYFMQLRNLIELYGASRLGDGDTSLDVSRVWLRLGEIHGALGEYGAAQDALYRALEVVDSKAHRLRGAASKLLADLAVSQGHPENAMRHYEQAQDCFRQAALPRPFVATIAEMGRCALLLGQHGKAEAVLSQALEKARALDDASLIARIHRYLGQTLSLMGDFEAARSNLEQSADLYRQLQRSVDLARTLDKLGKVQFAAGRYELSHQTYVELASLTAEAGLSVTRSSWLGQAQALAAMGNFVQAEFQLVEGLGYFSSRGEEVEASEVQFCLGDLYLAMERPQLAGEHFAHVWERAQRVGHARLAFDAAIRRAYAALDGGTQDEAYEHLTTAAQYAENLGQEDARQLARAHIIYVQLLEHGFRTKTEAFSKLTGGESAGAVQRSQLVREIFRADLAGARQQWDEAWALLEEARRQAAIAGEISLFLALDRRRCLIGRQMGHTLSCPPEAGVCLGSLLPPEVGARRIPA
jgi:serine/threonine protein kinase/tetratricopeptide (TPR) repeat protein